MKILSSPQRLRRRSHGSAIARRGASTAELLVSATLLMSALGVVTTGGTSVLRLWKSGQQHRLAVDTLSNHLEVLTTLPSESLESQIETLKLDPAIQTRLPQAELTGNLNQSDLGTRITLQLNWKRTGNPPPVRLVGWHKGDRP